MVIDPVVERLHCAFDLGEVEDPAGVWIEGALDVDVEIEGEPVNIATRVAFRCLG
jgi:hypothetical protein